MARIVKSMTGQVTSNKARLAMTSKARLDRLRAATAPNPSEKISQLGWMDSRGILRLPVHRRLLRQPHRSLPSCTPKAHGEGGAFCGHRQQLRFRPHPGIRHNHGEIALPPQRAYQVRALLRETRERSQQN